MYSSSIAHRLQSAILHSDARFFSVSGCFLEFDVFFCAFTAILLLKVASFGQSINHGFRTPFLSIVNGFCWTLIMRNGPPALRTYLLSVDLSVSFKLLFTANGCLLRDTNLFALKPIFCVRAYHNRAYITFTPWSIDCRLFLSWRPVRSTGIYEVCREIHFRSYPKVFPTLRHIRVLRLKADDMLIED